MNAQTKVSAKGQIVLPKDVRDELSWPQGTVLEVVRTSDGVLLREPRREPRLTVDEFIAEMRKMAVYNGPPLNEADWQEGISRHIRKKWGDHRKTPRKTA